MAARALLVSGSLRSDSTNTALLETLTLISPSCCDCDLYRGLPSLPPFNPDLEENPPTPALELRDAIHASDAVLFSTPEYAGALPGSFKNLLDWTIGDSHPGSICDKPVAWLNASTRGARDAHEELRGVLAYAHAKVIEEACLAIPVTPSMVGIRGIIGDPVVRDAAVGALVALAGQLTKNPLDRRSD